MKPRDFHELETILDMNGCFIKDTPIAVDFWKTRDNPSAKLFFLTHLHGDHVVGLTSSWQHIIYCSEITANLLVKNYGIKENLVKPLSIGQNHILYLDEEQLEQMVVTLLDANHCPGAVMFIFEGYFGKILYTGDFRYYDDFFIKNSKQLVNTDILYLDNTYCGKGCDFQSVESATAEIFSIIKEHPDHNIVVGLRNLGKEELLLKIALEFNEWVSIPVKMSYTVSVLGYPDVFKVDDRTCRIRAVPSHTISKNYMEKLNKAFKTIAIIPTALYTGLGFEPFSNCENIHVVTYSNHSSFNELRKFIGLLTPKLVIPIVKGKGKGPFGMSLENRADMSCFHSLLSHKPMLKFTIPDSVKRMMSTRLSVLSSNNSGQAPKRKKPALVKKSSKLASKGVMFEDDLNEKWESKRRKIEDPKIVSYIEPASIDYVGIGSNESEEDIFNNVDGVETCLSSELNVASVDSKVKDGSIEQGSQGSIKLGSPLGPRKGEKQKLDSHEQGIFEINCEEYDEITNEQNGEVDRGSDKNDVEYNSCTCNGIENGESVDKDVGLQKLNDDNIEKQNSDKHESADVNPAAIQSNEKIDGSKEVVITKFCNPQVDSNTHRYNFDRKVCSTLCYNNNLSSEGSHMALTAVKYEENKSISVQKDKHEVLNISINVIPNLNRQVSPSFKRQKLYNVFNKFLDC